MLITSLPLWFVVLIAGKVEMSIGPVPYDMAECQNRIVVMRDTVINRANELREQNVNIDVSKWVFRCRHAANRPALGTEIE